MKDAGTGTPEEARTRSSRCVHSPSHRRAPQVAALFRRAAVCYTEANRSQGAADALAHGGKCVESLDGGLAVELYLEACGGYEEDGKEIFAMDVYRAAAAAMIKQGKYHEAITVLLRHAGACDRTQSYAQLARCYLSAVVVYLALGEPVEAEHGYYDYMEVEQFERSEEARAAWELLDCYQQGEEPLLKKCVARGVFTGLEQCVLKLAKKLPMGDFAKQAAQLNASRGGGPSADAEALDDDNLT